jgi:sulfite reductase beta subunit-like hemoprotein
MHATPPDCYSRLCRSGKPFARRVQVRQLVRIVPPQGSLPHGQSYADQVKTSHGIVTISQKAKARKEAENARQQAVLKACGYAALKRKHRTSLGPELSDLKMKQVAPISDRIVYWSRVDEIQDRLAEGLFVPDCDLTFLKKTMQGR